MQNTGIPKPTGGTNDLSAMLYTLAAEIDQDECHITMSPRAVRDAVACFGALRGALENLVQAVEYTPLGVRGIKAVEQAKLVLASAKVS